MTTRAERGRSKGLPAHLASINLLVSASIDVYQC